MKLESPAFSDGGMIPDKISKDGGDTSPPLSWTGAPEQAGCPGAAQGRFFRDDALDAETGLLQGAS